MSYIDFFEFKEHPFRITPDVAFYFTSETHAEAYDSLRYFIDSDEGFLTLTGEPGTGKTITLRKFLNGLPEDVEYAYILFPSLEPEDMFRAVLEDFGYKIEPGVSKNSLFSGFRDFLTEKRSQGKRILLVIDEAQNLPAATLEELRILSNLETEKEKLIQFVLAGQPELEQKINSEELRQLKQRITMHTILSYLSFLELQKYVVFRLSKSGFAGQYPDDKFYKKLEQITGGNPRLVNLTMERALMSAYLEQSKFLKVKNLDAAAKSLQFETSQPANKKNYTVYALTAVIAILGALLLYQNFALKNRYSAETSAPQPTVSAQQETKPVSQPETKPEPAPEPEPVKNIPDKKPAVRKAYVTANGLNMRSAPTTFEDNVIQRLERGMQLIIKAESDEWMLVETPEEGRTGWVAAEFVIVPE